MARVLSRQQNAQRGRSVCNTGPDFAASPCGSQFKAVVQMEGPALIVVYPSALLGWEVVSPGCEEPPCFDDRASAVQHARHIAESARPSRIQIEDWYGHIECEWVFAVENITTT